MRLLKQIIFINIISIFFAGCFIEQEKDIYGTWTMKQNLENNGQLIEYLTFTKEKREINFVWTREVKDINGTAEIDSRAGVCEIDKVVIKDQVYFFLQFDYVDKKNENVKKLVKYQIVGDALFILGEDANTFYIKVKEDESLDESLDEDLQGQGEE